MAVKIIERLLSDLTGETANRTTRFAIDGKEYSIDLTEEEDQELREFLSRYVQHGVRIPKGMPSTWHQPAATTGAKNAPASQFGQGERRRYLDTVRAWAREKKIDVSSFGRIPQTVIDMYENRHALEAAAIAEAAEKATANRTIAVLTGKTNGHKPAVRDVSSAVPKPVKRAPGTVGAEVKIAAPALFSSAETPSAAPPPTRGKRASPAKKVTARK